MAAPLSSQTLRNAIGQVRAKSRALAHWSDLLRVYGGANSLAAKGTKR